MDATSNAFWLEVVCPYASDSSGPLKSDALKSDALKSDVLKSDVLKSDVLKMERTTFARMLSIRLLGSNDDRRRLIVQTRSRQARGAAPQRAVTMPTSRDHASEHANEP